MSVAVRCRSTVTQCDQRLLALCKTMHVFTAYIFIDTFHYFTGFITSWGSLAGDNLSGAVLEDWMAPSHHKPIVKSLWKNHTHAFNHGYLFGHAHAHFVWRFHHAFSVTCFIYWNYRLCCSLIHLSFESQTFTAVYHSLNHLSLNWSLLFKYFSMH